MVRPTDHALDRVQDRTSRLSEGALPKLSEEQKDFTRQRIRAAARRCFAQYGYHGATVARLEGESGLSRGAIFSYFSSKDELFLSLAQEDAQRLGRLWIELGFVEALRALLSEQPEWLGVYLEASRLLRTNEPFRRRFNARASDVEKELEAELRRAQERGELRDDVEPQLLGAFMGVIADGLGVRIAAGLRIADADGLIALAAEAVAPPRSRPPSRR
jgi:AcrR family transcriptional regulator